MFGLFESPSPIDQDVEDWLFEASAWLMREFGGMSRIRWTKLALPTPQFFPRGPADDHARAVDIFDRVKGLMSLSDSPCVLEPSDARPTRETAHGFNGRASVNDVARNYRTEGDQIVIGFDPGLIGNPTALIAGMAHDLSQWRLTTAHTSPPGRHRLEEFTAELSVAYSGMGVFSANVAYDFHASLGGSAGGHWSSTVNGYFAEETWAFAIAVFCALKDVDPPLDLLKDSVADCAKMSARYLKRHKDKLDVLRAIR